MGWRNVLGIASSIGLVVGGVVSLVRFAWVRLFFGTVSVALAGVAAVDSVVLWDWPGSLWLVGAAVVFALVGAGLLWWGREADPDPGGT